MTTLQLSRRRVCAVATERDEDASTLGARAGGVDVTRPFGERHRDRDERLASRLRVVVGPVLGVTVVHVSIAIPAEGCPLRGELDLDRGVFAEVLSAYQCATSLAALGLDLDRDVMDVFVADVRSTIVSQKEVW